MSSSKKIVMLASLVATIASFQLINAENINHRFDAQLIARREGGEEHRMDNRNSFNEERRRPDENRRYDHRYDANDVRVNRDVNVVPENNTEVIAPVEELPPGPSPYNEPYNQYDD